ncbi:hypothetical protein OEZ60_19740 [Defluviimonas sp. WL0024]|uniref:Uncharacterized protein n=1 Tax=Albidovulum salinarum TaxID=2984153 RepID=A0ABT2X8E7_9RHOB|nr:hypothetical protein [Defluviimonas sp. WL0024]MCU9850226.1 hypothetical protein [Defluviimonas sp. WL0024]
MRNKLGIAILASAAFAAGAPTSAETIVREVEVTADMDALQNPEAAERWTHLADDLENAIVAKLVGKTGEEGAKVSVDIDEVELASSLQSAAGVAESKLVGDVAITHDSDNTKFDNYQLTVTFEQAGPYFLPGTDLAAITTDSQEYYDAMIATFANHVVQKLE